jgi:hypothetical protein
MMAVAKQSFVHYLCSKRLFDKHSARELAKRVTHSATSTPFHVLEGIGKDNNLQHNGSFFPSAGRWKMLQEVGEHGEGRGETPKLEEMKDGAVLGTAARHWRDGWEVSRLSHKLNVT